MNANRRLVFVSKESLAFFNPLVQTCVVDPGLRHSYHVDTRARSVTHRNLLVDYIRVAALRVDQNLGIAVIPTGANNSSMVDMAV